jgi:4-hydroxyphenylpyruvate dioxygenase
LVLTTPLNSKSPINEHIVKHGDGVKVVALWVEDARSAWEETTSRGAKSYMEPTVEKDEHGEVVRAGIYTYGETVHMFVERKNYDGVFLPGFMEWNPDYNPPSAGLKYIDHMVGNVGWGQMNKWVKWYEDVMGFENFLSFDDKQIHTEYSALMSKVMSNGNGRVKFPINEPAKAAKRSQIEEYLDFYDIICCNSNVLYTFSFIKIKVFFNLRSFSRFCWFVNRKLNSSITVTHYFTH